MAEEQEKPFEVIDKRRFTREGEAREEAKETGEEKARETQSSSTVGASTQGVSPEELKDILAPDLYTLIAAMATQLGEQAWRWMGLVPNPVTQQVEKDLNKARLAIDCTQFLADKVSPYLPEPARRDLRTLVSNLQLTFVRQLSMEEGKQ